MNPAGKGYGGRQKLPDNLKQLFRPVAMTKPDNELIAEVSDYLLHHIQSISYSVYIIFSLPLNTIQVIMCSVGFKTASTLSRKMIAVFQLSRQLLSTQQHYDWGLRAIKTVLSSAGTYPC